jgi:hypothetical protein
MDLKAVIQLLTIVTMLFTGFLFMDDRHAPRALEQRVAKNEATFKVWDIDNDIRKLDERIKEIEKDWKGKIIPESWLKQLNWLREEKKKKEKEKEEVKKENG